MGFPKVDAVFQVRTNWSSTEWIYSLSSGLYASGKAVQKCIHPFLQQDHNALHVQLKIHSIFAGDKEGFPILYLFSWFFLFVSTCRTLHSHRPQYRALRHSTENLPEGEHGAFNSTLGKNWSSTFEFPVITSSPHFSILSTRLSWETLSNVCWINWGFLKNASFSFF